MIKRGLIKRGRTPLIRSKYVDENGIPCVTIKQGSARARKL
jgi:hypothetical protein